LQDCPAERRQRVLDALGVSNRVIEPLSNTFAGRLLVVHEPQAQHELNDVRQELVAVIVWSRLTCAALV
jgi:hypothetical protein